MRVLTIPDIHLKPWIFDEAAKIIDKYNVDHTVFIGDLVDEWSCENKIDLYKYTIDKAIEFYNKYPSSFCYGNHETAYLVDGNCSGNSVFYRSQIKYLLSDYERKVEPKVVVQIDDVLFSYAGLEEHFDIDTVNETRLNILFNDMKSPLWLRPTWYNNYKDCYQVIGHTPVHKIHKSDKIYFVDTFSLNLNNSPYGDESLLVIDTNTHKTEVFVKSCLQEDYEVI